ncbi:hypothetical protein BJ165DRAFT_1399787 [Panaeolus papilionaceus]|nr:hypothetical protein BJ165DRAFT_1399787 [Panaeolus papilionaceus]
MTGFYIKSPDSITFIPYDLSECIMYYMKFDVASLKNASLVCRSWSFASRTWLFRTLKLTPTKYTKLLALGRESAIRCFATHCKALDIHSIDVRTMPLSLVTTMFPALEELSVRKASVPSLKDLFEFAARFTRLRSVTLDDVCWSRTAPTPLPSIPTVDRLEIHGTVKYRHLFDELRSSKVFPNLRYLKAGPLEELHLPAIGLYLADPDAPWRIESLTFMLASEEHYIFMPPPMAQTTLGRVMPERQVQSLLHEEYRSAYGLEPCFVPVPHLRHFCVKSFLDVRNFDQSTALLWTPRFLASMTMPNLQCIEFEVILDRAGQLDQYGIRWSFMDFALTAAEFANLKKAVFITLAYVGRTGNIVSSLGEEGWDYAGHVKLSACANNLHKSSIQVDNIQQTFELCAEVLIRMSWERIDVQSGSSTLEWQLCVVVTRERGRVQYPAPGLAERDVLKMLGRSTSVHSMVATAYSIEDGWGGKQTRKGPNSAA